MECEVNALKEVKYAPQVNNIAHALKDRSNLTDPGDIALMEELFRLLSIVEPTDEDGRRSLWITAERGPIEAAGSFEDYKDLEEVDTYDEYVERWKWYYPDERYWYNVIAVRRDDYMAVLLNQQIVLDVDPDHTRSSLFGFEAAPFIRWIIQSCQRTIEMLQAGSYNNYVRENLPAKHRTGTIIRRDLWSIFPVVRELDMEGLSPKEIELFLQAIDETSGEANPFDYLSEMTAQCFFDACALGYAANDYDGSGLSAKEQYNKHADRRDEALCEIPADSPAAFEEWYHHRMGIGHPWEVVRGGNSTHVDLYVQQDEYGYHFRVAVDHRRGEAIRFYLAIRQAGLPVSIWHGCLLADILRGADTIGIVPEGVIPRYCEWRFPGEQTSDFMRPMDDELEKMQDAIAWQPIPEVRLIQEGR